MILAWASGPYLGQYGLCCSFLRYWLTMLWKKITGRRNAEWSCRAIFFHVRSYTSYNRYNLRYWYFSGLPYSYLLHWPYRQGFLYLIFMSVSGYLILIYHSFGTFHRSLCLQLSISRNRYYASRGTSQNDYSLPLPLMVRYIKWTSSVNEPPGWEGLWQRLLEEQVLLIIFGLTTKLTKPTRRDWSP